MDELLKQLAGQAPAVIALIWAIWFMGGKLDGLRTELSGLRDDVKEGRCQAMEKMR